jgi:hypothetical protein
MTEGLEEGGDMSTVWKTGFLVIFILWPGSPTLPRLLLGSEHSGACEGVLAC